MCEKNEAIVCRRDKCVELGEDDDDDDDGVRKQEVCDSGVQVISTSAIDEERRGRRPSRSRRNESSESV